MRIEVGKKYLNGYGEVVEITSHSPGKRYPYTGVWGNADAATYTEDGVFDSYDPEAKASLVSELGNAATPANPAPAFSPTQVSRLLDALDLARKGCSCKEWTSALVALEEALCPEPGTRNPEPGTRNPEL